MLDGFFLHRVFFPLVCHPHGETGCGFPCGDFPSPPPCGWSTGFITTPRDWGRTPSQRGVRPHGGFDVLTPDGIEFFSDCYLPNLTSEQRRAPEISPAYANLRDLPPSLISVGTADHLLDDSLLLATRATAAGVEVDLVVLPEMPHAFMIFDCGIVKDWVARTNDWFAARLNA